MNPSPSISTTTRDAPARPAVPVTPDSPRLRELFAAIGEEAFERELGDLSPAGAFRLPRELGGGGASLLDFFTAILDLATVDPNVAHALRSHFVFVDDRLGAFRRGEDREWLTRIRAGALIGNATTELGRRNTGGLEAGRFETQLVPDGDAYTLTGTKAYTTGSLYFDWVSVAAATPDGEVATVAIPVDRPGVEIHDDWDSIGQRLTASGTSHFHGVFVAPDEVSIRREGGHISGHIPTMAQLHLTAVVAGILQAATDDAVTVLRRRTRTFSHGSSVTPAGDPLLQHVVGQLSTNAFAARAVVLEAARSLDAAASTADDSKPESLEKAKRDSAKAKVLVDDLAARSGWLAFDVGGASATRRDLNLDRHWRNARTLASHNPAIYKTRALGDHLINGALLPSSALF
jgi:alkylation response protein AidB-like acyl-CoA dehydrogenase